MIQDKKSTIKPNKKKLKALSFFSGAMGLDIGLHKAGIQTLLCCEIDRSSRETISYNNPTIGLIGDIRNYSTEEILDYANVSSPDEIDLIVGGPPCQAFSTAGKRMGLEDDRGNVFLKFIETIEAIKPKYAVIENVRGLMSSQYSIDLKKKEEKFLPPELKPLKGSTLFYVVNRLQNSGYKVTFNLYNSANFGTPQIRERVIIICTLDDVAVPHLDPTHSEGGELGLPKWKTVKNAIGNLSTDKIDYIKFPEKRLKYYRLLKEGQNWRNLTEELQKEALGKSYYLEGGKTGFYRRLSWNSPAPTLVTHPAMPATDLGHPIEDRPLSVQEYKRIQEFPDSWDIKGNIINQYKQIGNAVPVSVGEAIGKTILRHSFGSSEIKFKDFKYSRYLKTSETEFMNDFVLRGKTLLRTPAKPQLTLF